MTIATPLTEAPEETRPLEPTTEIRPSEAIRLGILLAPRPLKEGLVDGSGGACALGAMALAYGWVVPDEADANGDWQEGGYDLVRSKLPYTLIDPVLGGERTAESVIWGLNDTSGWSRERIASWLESLGL